MDERPAQRTARRIATTPAADVLRRTLPRRKGPISHATYEIGRSQLVLQEQILRDIVEQEITRNQWTIDPSVNVPLIEELQRTAEGLRLATVEWDDQPVAPETWWDRAKIRLYEWATRERFEREQRADLEAAVHQAFGRGENDGAQHEGVWKVDG